MEVSPVIDKLRSKAAALPRQPGVYIMENRNGTVIYVGKSRSLRDRVSQYFHGSHEIKTEKMAANVYDFRFIVCDTEMEALALENSLIKQYTPRYNILLKDSKSYPYIKVTNEEYPRLVLTRTRSAQDGCHYYGPYSGSQTVYSVIATLEKSLGLPNCKRQFPRDIGKSRPCVYKQIGRCIGVCDGSVSKETYHGLISYAEDVLKGNIVSVLGDLQNKMIDASERLNFEEAARYRDSIDALKHLGQKQKTVGDPDFECDVIALYQETNFACCSIFYIRNGYINDSEHFMFGSDEIVTIDSRNEVKIFGDDEFLATQNDSPLTTFVIGLYKQREYIPKNIYLSFPLCEEDMSLISSYLSEKAGRSVKARTPIKGEAKKLCQMAVADAKQHGDNARRNDDKAERISVKLATILGLEVIPERIESYDISNLGNECITAGMVVVDNTKFKKSDYRVFKMKDMVLQDDYQAMSEAITRRFNHLSDKDGSFSKAPDLILLDGGKGHVGVIRKLLDDMGYGYIPVFGMAKDDHHKTRTLTSDLEEISIAKDQEIFRFIYGIQEEVHRFTISRMKETKRSSYKKSSLEKINGIGPAKAKNILKYFGTINNIKNATLEDLVKVKGVTKENANSIFEYFNGDNK